MSELQVAARRESALEAWLAMRGRSDGAENDNDDVIGTLRYTQNEASRELGLRDAFDEAFASLERAASLSYGALSGL